MENSISVLPPSAFASPGGSGTKAAALPARNGYEIRFGYGCDPLSLQSRQLVQRMYRARGLLAAESPEQPLPSSAERITVAACKAQQVAATLTLSLDTSSGLLADALYREIIDRTRKRGGRVCEITQLAIDPAHDSRDMLVSMLQSLYVLVRLIYRVTDIFIEVHPRHAAYYRRKLGYRQAGPQRICPRVAAPAVLMHLDEQQLERLLGSEAGQHSARHSVSSSLYTQFKTRRELERMGSHLRELLRGSN